MEAKQITIAVAGSGGQKEFRDVSILRNAQARDVLKKLNLQGFQLIKADGSAYAHTDDLFSSVSDGQKLYASKSDVQAGHGLARRS